MRLGDTRLQRVMDSMDVCQSVLASFFVRAAGGQYDLERPEQLLRLLVTMARNKVATAARKQRRQRRDQRRDAGTPVEEMEVAGGSPSPSRVLAGKELLSNLRKKLSAEERQIAELRAQGQGWPEVADALGGSAEARRKQLARALDRVARELGLDGGEEEAG